MKLKLSTIRLDGGTQPRAHIDSETASSYADDMRAGVEFPPVVVFFDGSDYWLADGFHRCRAAEEAGKTSVEAEVKQGTVRDAILHSVGVNSAHGLRRTNEDKRRAVMRLLDDEEWTKWSDREIARRCAVSHTFVQNIRPSLATDASEKTYTTKHGTTSTMHTSNIGRKRETLDPLAEEEEVEAEEEPEEELSEEQAKAKTIEDAVSETRTYIDIRIAMLPDNIAKHEYINTVIKYLRQQSVELNQVT